MKRSQQSAAGSMLCSSPISTGMPPSRLWGAKRACQGLFASSAAATAREKAVAHLHHMAAKNMAAKRIGKIAIIGIIPVIGSANAISLNNIRHDDICRDVIRDVIRREPSAVTSSAWMSIPVRRAQRSAPHRPETEFGGGHVQKHLVPRLEGTVALHV